MHTNMGKIWNKGKRKEDTIKIISETGDEIGELKINFNTPKKRD